VLRLSCGMVPFLDLWNVDLAAGRVPGEDSQRFAHSRRSRQFT
jgi:hypothetical protein